MITWPSWKKRASSTASTTETQRLKLITVIAPAWSNAAEMPSIGRGLESTRPLGGA